MFPRATGIFAIVTFAGQDQNQVTGSGGAQSFLSDDFPHSSDYFRLGLTGSPRGLLPVAHLGNAD